MKIILVSFLLLGVSRAQALEQWSFDGCRAFVGHITVSDKGAGVDDEPKLESTHRFSAGITRAKTAGGAGRRVVLSIDGEKFALDQAAAARTVGRRVVWEQFNSADNVWVIYSEEDGVATVETQRDALKSSRIGNVQTDTIFVRKFSSDGQYVEQVFGGDGQGAIGYENGVSCGKAFDEEPSIRLKDAGEQAKELKYSIRTY